VLYLGICHVWHSRNSSQIGDAIFLNANSDGNQLGDQGIPRVTVELTQDRKVIATTMTKEDGLYTFDKLPVGEYTVQVSTVPEGLAGTFEVDNVHDGSVHESMNKYDMEIAECTDYYSGQCAAMESCRGQIAASNYVAANSRALILDSQDVNTSASNHDTSGDDTT